MPPRLSFAVSDAQYLLTFAVMLAVALIIGQLTAGLRFQARVASHREERARTLYEFARDLSGLLRPSRWSTSPRSGHGARLSRARSRCSCPTTQERLHSCAAATTRDSPSTLGAAQWAYDNRSPPGSAPTRWPATTSSSCRCTAPMRTRGVLAIRPETPARRC